MIDKEKPGVVPAIVFIRVFDALVAYSNTVIKTDLGVTEANGGRGIAIDGTLAGIGNWINSTKKFTSRWYTVRCTPTNSGYFGSSSFCILWNSSSSYYGWCILMSDNTKCIVFGCNSNGWKWYAPTLTQIS